MWPHLGMLVDQFPDIQIHNWKSILFGSDHRSLSIKGCRSWKKGSDAVRGRTSSVWNQQHIPLIFHAGKVTALEDMSQTPSFKGVFKVNTERVKNWKTSWPSLGLWTDTIVKAKTGVRKHWLVTEISVWETKKTSDWSKTVGESKPCGRSWCCLVFWHALGCSEIDFWHVLTDRISWSWAFPGPGGNHHHTTHESPSTKLHNHFKPGMGKWKDGY